jgi:hypothetical protein
MAEFKQWLREKLVEDPYGIEHVMSPAVRAIYRLQGPLIALAILVFAAALALHAAGII